MIVLLPIDIFADHYKILNVNDGMPSNTVRAIVQDKYGFVWFGTYNGLCRYDGYKFAIFRNEPGNPTSLLDNKVYKLYSTPYGIWVGTNKGLDFFSFATNKFNHCYYRAANGTKTPVPLGSIKDIVIHGKQLYVTNNLGEIFCHDKGFVFKKMFFNVAPHISWFGIVPYKDRLLLAQAIDGIYVLDPLTGKALSKYSKELSTVGCSLYFDKASNILYVGFGLGFKTAAYQLMDNYQIKELKMQLPSNVNAITSYRGQLFFATDGQGIIYKKNNNWVAQRQSNSNLSSDVICDFLTDRDNNLWIGTHLGGVAFYSESSNWFNCLSVDNGNLNCDLVPTVYAEGDNLYIGTDGGGLTIYNLKTKSSRVLTSSNSRLLGNNILSLFKKGDNLWMSIYGYGLCKLSLKDNSLKIITKGKPGLAASHILQIANDSYGHVWCLGEISTVFDEAKNSFVTLPYLKTTVNSISFDGDYTWLSTLNKGLYKIRTRDYKLVAHYSVSSKDIRLSTNALLHVFVDSKHQVWFSTAYSGLYMLDEQKGKIISYGIKNGLTNTQITSIIEDQSGFLWMSSLNGLFKFNPKTQNFIRFGMDENLSLFEYFNNASFYKDGRMYFGSTKGLVSFEPEKVQYDSHPKSTLVSSVELINKNGTKIEVPFDAQKIVELPFADRFFTINLTIPELITGSKILLKCYLKGLDKAWREIPNGRQVSYTNVPPGKYNFYISSTNNEGQWTAPVSSLQIIISPPWYRSTLAWIVWIIIFMMAMYSVYHFVRHEIQIKQVVKMKEIEEDTSRRINEAKLNFFTNITHELRTPIFLITAPLEELLSSRSTIIQVHKSYLSAIYRNALRLSKLISRIIDFRKLELEKLKLELQNMNVVSFCKDLTIDYEALCLQKGIVFVFLPERTIIQLDFDPEKLESIISNLVSNAFKYTPEGGKIVFSVVELDTDVEFTIEDNGIGIDKQYHEAIFDNFFQVDPLQTSYAGDGIGLSFVKKLIELHGGKIRLESELKKGSKFIFTIPKHNPNQIVAPAPITTSSEMVEKPIQVQKDITLAQTPTAGHTILLIDDEKETLDVVERFLINDFHILKASNGLDGYNLVKENHPDLVICDLMMPKMNGNEFLNIVKKDKMLAHIPIIVFTAKTTEEDMLAAFESGADAYLTKPVSLKLLRKRIDTLLDQADSVEIANTISNRDNKSYTKEEQKFLLHCKEIIDDNLTNQEFDLKFFAEKLGMSHSSLYKKIKIVTGLSAIEFVNEYRIFKAIRFMNEGETNIGTVSVKCGFNDIRTFREAFKKKMKVTPREYLQQLL
jgi:signal transduction histidine kinase/DNA-binding response OmpR family regulator/ligand-binding sensor domain-containing protein